VGEAGTALRLTRRELKEHVLQRARQLAESGLFEGWQGIEFSMVRVKSLSGVVAAGRDMSSVIGLMIAQLVPRSPAIPNQRPREYQHGVEP
jgi:hypothetical protein